MAKITFKYKSTSLLGRCAMCYRAAEIYISYWSAILNSKRIHHHHKVQQKKDKTLELNQQGLEKTRENKQPTKARINMKQIGVATFW